MNQDRLELLNKLKVCYQSQLENITITEKALEETFLKSQELYNFNKQSNVFSEEIIDSLKMTLEFHKQQLDEYRCSSKDNEKKYNTLLSMVEKSISELVKLYSYKKGVE